MFSLHTVACGISTNIRRCFVKVNVKEEEKSVCYIATGSVYDAVHMAQARQYECSFLCLFSLLFLVCSSNETSKEEQRTRYKMKTNFLNDFQLPNKYAIQARN